MSNSTSRPLGRTATRLGADARVALAEVEQAQGENLLGSLATAGPARGVAVARLAAVEQEQLVEPEGAVLRAQLDRRRSRSLPRYAAS